MALAHDKQNVGAGSQFTGASSSTGQLADPGSGDWQLHQISLDLGSDTKGSWKIQVTYATSAKVHILRQGGSSAGDYPLNTQYLFEQFDPSIKLATGDTVEVITTGAGAAMSMESKTEAYT